MVATYSGNLIAFLTVTIDKAPFNSLEELVEQDDYKWGILAGTYFVTWFQVMSVYGKLKIAFDFFYSFTTYL